MPRPVVPLATAVRTWRRRSVEWVRHDDAETAAVLAARQPSPGRPHVVVVGETNRGKSSLVNALLGAPGLSPVDAGLATSSYLAFVRAERPYALAKFGGSLPDLPFDPAQLREWATVHGDPGLDRPPPRLLEVGLPAPVLDAFTLVDTPGVGGLVAAHADLAATAAAGASVLVFVVDASAPFTRGELDFLLSVTDRVEKVHLVLTKTDMSRGWRDILQADRELLARYAPRFAEAPFHPVSARLAEVAAAQADPTVAATIAGQSGIPALRDLLMSEVADSAAVLTDANTIRTTITTVTAALARLDSTERALTAGADQAAALTARRDDLMGRRKAGGRSWQVLLRSQTQRARVDIGHETAREVRDATLMFRAAVDQASSDGLKALPYQVDAHCRAMIARSYQRLGRAMDHITRSVLAELFTEAELAQVISQIITRQYAQARTRQLDKQRSIDETIMTLTGAGMGFSLSHLVVGLPFMALPAALSVVVAPLSIVVGGAAALFLVRSRRRMGERQQLKQWVGEVLGEAKAQIDQTVAEQFVEADHHLTLALDEAVARQLAVVEGELKEVDGALKLQAGQRAEKLRTVQTRRAEGLELRTSGEELLGRLRDEAARTAAAPGSGYSAPPPTGGAAAALATVTGPQPSAEVRATGPVAPSPQPARTPLPADPDAAPAADRPAGTTSAPVDADDPGPGTTVPDAPARPARRPIDVAAIARIAKAAGIVGTDRAAGASEEQSGTAGT